MYKNDVGKFNRFDFISNKTLVKANGFSDDDISRPIIGIANSFNEMVPGHNNLRKVSENVKNGIYRGGGTPVEFGVIACCDGVADNHYGAHYVLPSREAIADSIEIQSRAHQFDGLVLLASCDKIVPGMLMAAARLDIPAILVPGGSMISGPPYAEKAKSDTTSISEGLGMYQTDKITYDDLQKLTSMCAPTCGSCQFMGTANTMCAFSEALGMTLSGGGLIPAVYHERYRSAFVSGEKIVKMVLENVSSRSIMTKEALENAIMVMMAVGGSTNAVIHTCALAHELGFDTKNILDLFDKYSEEIPLIAKINPASLQYDCEDLYKAGGVPEVMKVIKEKLFTEVMTVNMKNLEKNLDEHVSLYPKNPEVIKTLENPHSTLGGLTIMRGNIAPDTGVAKPAAIAEEARRFTGVAICFDSEKECVEAIEKKEIKSGNVVVIRYEGPKGGPGMREMYLPLKLLYGQGLNKTTAVITDGRFSGTNNGCFVGHISPEAAAGGPIALIKNGDKITIDVINKSIHLHVAEEELKTRKVNWKFKPKKEVTGYLARYKKLVKSASEGAILD
ncbi:MAG: dihydroxy-acid dehydratase [Bacillota bacterium]|nr:dihydroxy-acid dehydratase [Bacillota bacterium]